MTGDEDFRTVRALLPDEAFALVVHPDRPEPDDLIDRETWNGLVVLPDDVLLRTSARHGASLGRAYAAWGHWVSLVLDIQGLAGDPGEDPLAVAALDATDEFQASIYAAMTGFYRQSLGVLRSVLESMLAALYFKVIRPPREEIVDWLEGREAGRLRVGRLREVLGNTEPLSRFERDEFRVFGADGWYGWLYRLLSAYVHGRPAHVESDGTALATTNGGMWESNGPIYEGNAYTFWEVMFFNTMLMSVLFAGLADQRLASLSTPQDVPYEELLDHLFAWHPSPGPPSPAATIAQYLCPR